MAAAAPTTELSAINEMLTAIGTTPVNTLNVSGLTDAAIALDTLRSISKEVQTAGWWFNTDTAISLTPAGTTITIPATVLSVRPSFGNTSVPPEPINFALRDNKLWNLDTNSAVFASAVRADQVRELEFENLPESARRYVTVRAARIFQTKVLGDEAQGVFTERHEMEAWSIFEGDDAINSPATSLFMRRVRAIAAQFRPDPHQSNPPQQGRRQ